MSLRVSALALTAFILVSVAITRYDRPAPIPVESPVSIPSAPPPQFAFQANLPAQAAALAAASVRGPARDWNVLDPKVDAAAALVYSLDDDMILLGARTYARWPSASLIKLLAAVVIAEQIGYHKRITITPVALAAPGNGTALSVNEEFSARDLARILVMTSSNVAAAAFEDYAGGREEFVKLMRAAAARIGMEQTTIADAAGLGGANETSASDIAKLMKYLAAARPEILEWTRRGTFLFQPTNDPTSRTAVNTVPFTDDPRFLGGKTGTLPEARENFAGIFTLAGRRMVVVVLGSRNRVGEVNGLIDWTARAYHFN